MECGKEKSLEEFHNRKGGADGRDNRCKPCRNRINRKRYLRPDVREKHLQKCRKKRESEEYVEKVKFYGREYYKSPIGRAKSMMKSIKKKCKRLGWEEPDFDENHLVDKIEKGFCELTGVPFVLENKCNGRKRTFSPSVDRIDNSAPYRKNNIRMVLWQVNLMKGELSDEELIDFCVLLLDSFYQNGAENKK